MSDDKDFFNELVNNEPATKKTWQRGRKPGIPNSKPTRKRRKAKIRSDMSPKRTGNTIERNLPVGRPPCIVPVKKRAEVPAKVRRMNDLFFDYAQRVVDKYVTCGSLLEAADSCGISYNTVRSWMKTNHLGFKDSMEIAEEAYSSALDSEANRRGKTSDAIFIKTLEARNNRYKRGPEQQVAVVPQVYIDGVGMENSKTVDNDGMVIHHDPEITEGLNED